MNQIYQRKEYKVYKTCDGVILHNSNKEFKEGHTHLDSIKQAKMLIELSIHKRVPNHLSRYLLISLSRVNDGEYQVKINELLDNKKHKQLYVNVNKGVKRI